MNTATKTLQKITRPELKLLIIAIFMGFGAFFGIDIHLPALPAIAAFFHTSQHNVQLSVTLYILGGAVSQLLYGPLSDAYGRQPVLKTGFIIAIIGTVLCLLSPNIQIFLIARIISGIGMGAAFSLMRTLVSDLFDKQRFAIYGSYISLVIGIGVMIGPVIGGYLQKGFGWHGAFTFLLIMYLVTLLVYHFFGYESIKEKKPDAAKAKVLLKNYSLMLRSKAYLIFSSFAGLAMACTMTYAAVSAHMLEIQYGLSPVVYGWMGLIIAIGSLIGKSINTQVMKRYSSFLSIKIGYLIILLSGILMGASFMTHLLNVPLIIAFITLCSAGTGFIFVNASVGAISEFKHIGGSASALYSAWVFLATFVISTIAALMKSHGAVVLTGTYLVAAILGLILLKALKKLAVSS